LAEEDKSDWQNPQIHCYTPGWDAFKEALFREYLSARKPFVSSADLEIFTEENQSRRSSLLTTIPLPLRI